MAVKAIPIPILQRGANPRVLNKKTGKWDNVNLLPRSVWREAGVPDMALDKWKYVKKR